MINAYQLKHISFSYHKTEVLSIDELNIQANKVTALIGPNGSGKSTLLNILAFLISAQRGELQFFSQQITQKQRYAFIQRISFLPQKPYMLRGTVNDNLNLALKFHQQKHNTANQIEAALNQLGIADLGLKQAKSLSGGEQQKVALARAIITNPDVLLMDEPFSYLDHNSETLLENFVQQYVAKQNKTLIFSTHKRLQGIALANNVISLVNGKVANTPLINLFQGSISKSFFDTGSIKIRLINNIKDCQHLSIDPKKITISTTKTDFNQQNHYQGRVTAIIDEGSDVRLSVLAGELFQVILSFQEFKQQNISLADVVWIGFQQDAVLTF